MRPEAGSPSYRGRTRSSAPRRLCAPLPVPNVVGIEAVEGAGHELEPDERVVADGSRGQRGDRTASGRLAALETALCRRVRWPRSAGAGPRLSLGADPTGPGGRLEAPARGSGEPRGAAFRAPPG